ncbi:MAG: hypothetical protein V1816_09705 [Pseudomonadota bacterium]
MNDESKETKLPIIVSIDETDMVKTDVNSAASSEEELGNISYKTSDVSDAVLSKQIANIRREIENFGQHNTLSSLSSNIQNDPLKKLTEDANRDNSTYSSIQQAINQQDRMNISARSIQVKPNLAFNNSDLVNKLQNIIKERDRFNSIISKAAIATPLLGGMDVIHKSWSSDRKLDQQSISTQLFFANNLIHHMSKILLETECIFSTNLISLLNDKFFLSDIIKSIPELTSSYYKMLGSLKDFSDITKIPTFALPSATREIYTTAITFKTFNPTNVLDDVATKNEIEFIAAVKEETSNCHDLLQLVDPQLVLIHIGARDALTGRNADYARHFLSSLRELCSHLLRRIAPDRLVLEWINSIPDCKNLLDAQGKPIRRAKILYNCRMLYNEPLKKFIDSDSKTFVELFEVFHKMHKLGIKLTDEQLKFLLLRTESWIVYMVQIWQSTKI